MGAAGLLDKARRIRRKRSPRRQVPSSSNGGLNLEERRQIEVEIENLFTNRSDLLYETAPSRKLKSGVGFPLLVNGIAILAVLFGAWWMLFNGWGASGASSGEASSFSITEGFVLRQVQEEAAAAISARERRIAEIEEELATLRGTSRDGTAAGEANDRASRLEAELGRLRSEMDNEPSEQLSEMVRSQEEQRFFLEQLRFVYTELEMRVEEGAPAEALGILDRADRLVERYEAAQVEAETETVSLLRRTNSAVRQTLAVLVDVGDERLEERETLMAVASAEALFRRGDTEEAAGNIEAAEDAYRRGFEELPGFGAAERSLADIAAERQAEAERTRREAVEAERRAAEDRLLQRIASLELELTDSRSESNTMAMQLTRLTAQVADLEGELARIEAQGAAARDAQAARIDGVREKIAGELRALGRRFPTREPITVIADEEQQLVRLLETKILMREVLGAEAVRERYPDLLAETEAYLDAVETVYRETGERQGLTTAITVVESVMTALDLDLIAATAGTPLTTLLIERLSKLLDAVLLRVSETDSTSLN